MDDLISRAAAIETVRKAKDKSETHRMLIQLPSVDAAPVVHGRWIKMGHIEHTWFVSKCSVCGNQTFDAGTYCANCGAKMDGKNGEQA